MANPANPWFVQKRVSADGDKSSSFLCSLPPGAESLTGVLRSKPFTIPAKLSFFLAGHDGYPDKPPQKKNVVRLRLLTERGPQTASKNLSSDNYQAGSGVN